MDRGAYITDVKVVKPQPVPFSHKHHVTDDGIDCRYCHTSVEKSSFAGNPATEVCMSMPLADLGQRRDSSNPCRATKLP